MHAHGYQVFHRSLQLGVGQYLEGTDLVALLLSVFARRTQGWQEMPLQYA